MCFYFSLSDTSLCILRFAVESMPMADDLRSSRSKIRFLESSVDASSGLLLDFMTTRRLAFMGGGGDGVRDSSSNSASSFSSMSS